MPDLGDPANIYFSWKSRPEKPLFFQISQQTKEFRVCVHLTEKYGTLYTGNMCKYSLCLK